MCCFLPLPHCSVDRVRVDLVGPGRRTKWSSGSFAGPNIEGNGLRFHV